MNFLEENYEKIKTIFFHELGHFIAYKNSTKEIEGFKIMDLQIQPCTECKNGFKGFIVPLLPPGYKNGARMSPERLAHNFSNNYFGCLFQLLLTDSDEHLALCMQDYGQCDQKNLNTTLQSYGLLGKTSEIENHFYEFHKKLKKKNFDSLKNLNFEELFIEIDKDVRVKLESLDIQTTNFIKDFTTIYDKQLKELIAIIESK
ncbi:hypothetical protein [Chryseobacterium sp.]|uniref:hypothetical protein n=1 Tax=Chryseobacterium sp. TaxID=1871047 RepID=UPI00289CFB6C|nr:hypothetical protein [Chryseobacterium sp.]